MANSNTCPSGDVSTRFFRDFHSRENPSSTHIFRMLECSDSPFIISASAMVEVFNGSFTSLEAVTSTFAVLVALTSPCVQCSSSPSSSQSPPSPTVSTHYPLSITHRRAPVATSPSSDEFEACVTNGVLWAVSGAPFLTARRWSRLSILVWA